MEADRYGNYEDVLLSDRNAERQMRPNHKQLNEVGKERRSPPGGYHSHGILDADAVAIVYSNTVSFTISQVALLRRNRISQYLACTLVIDGIMQHLRNVLTPRRPVGLCHSVRARFASSPSWTRIPNLHFHPTLQLSRAMYNEVQRRKNSRRARLHCHGRTHGDRKVVSIISI